MQKVCIHAERRLTAFVLRNRDLVLFGKVDQLGAARQIPLPPRRDLLDVGVQRLGGQLKSNLIIAFARRPMGYGIRAGLVRDLYQTLRN